MNTYHNYDDVGDLLVPYHWHSEIEIIYIEEGSVEVTLNTETIILKKNELIFINSEELHQINRINNGPSSHHALVFSPDLLSFEIDDYSQVNYIRPIINQTIKFPKCIDYSKKHSLVITDLFKEILYECSNKKLGCI